MNPQTVISCIGVSKQRFETADLSSQSIAYAHIS